MKCFVYVLAALIRMADLPPSGNISFVSLPMSAMPRTSDLMLASAPLAGKAALRKQASSDSLTLAIATRPAKLHELKVSKCYVVIVLLHEKSKINCFSIVFFYIIIDSYFLKPVLLMTVTV